MIRSPIGQTARDAPRPSKALQRTAHGCLQPSWYSPASEARSEPTPEAG